MYCSRQAARHECNPNNFLGALIIDLNDKTIEIGVSPDKKIK